MKTKIGIYSNSKQKSITKAKELAETIGEEIFRNIAGISQNVIETDSFYIVLCPANESSRGQKLHEIYVDREVDNEIFNMVIRPALIRKEEGIPDKNYVYGDHIHYF